MRVFETTVQELKDGVLRLTRRGLFVSDDVMSDFMRISD